ncbi:MAG: gamma carbonic anhydrase family protein [Proteobacteria bacterium]|jgi:carbonic anhydrase/acetyltransferase-like protein (isoleucine patch superfamily)|nr:gamma carbonic anhydrase family protein [Pseudomonadota bacterium]MDA1238155.1 gamma carbonic anhydrase family protein [Pseudomonadota bacterium]
MPIYTLGDISPNLPNSGDFWIAPDANVIGNVTLGLNSSIWFGSTLRGDNDLISIGNSSNIQENCVLHTDKGFPLTVGERCTIGHKAILHGCTIGDGSLVGMGAIILNGAVIGKNCLIGAGSLVSEGKVIPDGSMVLGMPGKVVRSLSERERLNLSNFHEHYIRNSIFYRDNLKKLDV